MATCVKDEFTKYGHVIGTEAGKTHENNSLTFQVPGNVLSNCLSGLKGKGNVFYMAT